MNENTNNIDPRLERIGNTYKKQINDLVKFLRNREGGAFSEKELNHMNQSFFTNDARKSWLNSFVFFQTLRSEVGADGFINSVGHYPSFEAGIWDVVKTWGQRSEVVKKTIEAAIDDFANNPGSDAARNKLSLLFASTLYLFKGQAQLANDAYALGMAKLRMGGNLTLAHDLERIFESAKSAENITKEFIGTLVEPEVPYAGMPQTSTNPTHMEETMTGEDTAVM